MLVAHRRRVAVDVELTPSRAERLVLLRFQVALVPEREHLVVEQRRVDRREFVVVDRGEIDAGHLGADGWRERRDGG